MLRNYSLSSSISRFSTKVGLNMDGSGHRENGRHKTDQYKGVHTQWMIPSHMMKDQYALSIKFMAIITERDTALQERDLALSEKRAALAERDMAILQRDAAINERNNALIERDNAIASYESQENTMNCSSSPTYHTKFGASRGTKHVHQHQYMHHTTHLAEDNYHTKDSREVHTIDALSIPVPTSEAKPQRSKRTREIKTVAARTTSKPLKKCKRKGEDLNKKLTILDPNEWKAENGMGGYGEDLNKALVSLPEWKDQDLSLNQVDDSSMPVPVCSCTGALQQCYKWGNGGWQSACCTTTLSMHPLPMMPNKRHARIGGRKMSGSAFAKLLSRLASEGHDLSTPLDLKDHWAKHGTNRYITIK